MCGLVSGEATCVDRGSGVETIVVDGEFRSFVSSPGVPKWAVTAIDGTITIDAENDDLFAATNPWPYGTPEQVVLPTGSLSGVCVRDVDGALVCLREDDTGRALTGLMLDGPYIHVTRPISGYNWDPTMCGVDSDGIVGCWNPGEEAPEVSAAGAEALPVAAAANFYQYTDSAAGLGACFARKGGGVTCRRGAEEVRTWDVPATFDRLAASVDDNMALAGIDDRGRIWWATVLFPDEEDVGMDRGVECAADSLDTWSEVIIAGQDVCATDPEGRLYCWTLKLTCYTSYDDTLSCGPHGDH